MRGILLAVSSIVCCGAAEPDCGRLLEALAPTLPEVYRCDAFAAGLAPPNWIQAPRQVTPAGGRVLLGAYLSGQTAELRLSRLPAHDRLLIRLDLVILCHWDGVWEAYGPDIWRANLADGPMLLETTFSNFQRGKQNFPDELHLTEHEQRSGARSHGDLGWTLKTPGGLWQDLDTTYRLWFAVSQRADDAVLRFAGDFNDDPDPPAWRGECWGIAGCEVRAVPAEFRLDDGALQAGAAVAFDPATPFQQAAIPLVALAGRQRFEEIAGSFNLRTPLDSAKLEVVLAGLADEDFKVREAASRELPNRLPEEIEALRAARDHSANPEVRERISTAIDEFSKRKDVRETPPELLASTIRAARLAHVRRLLPDEAVPVQVTPTAR